MNFWKGSLITFYTDYIGPGYTTFGVPFLRNDVLRYGGRIEQGLLKSMIKLNGKYRFELDNLIESKRTTSTTLFYGAGISFNRKKLPSFRIDYNGNARSNVFAEQKMNSVNVMSGYNYKIAKTNLRTSVTYQWIKSAADSTSIVDYSLGNLMFTQSVSLKIPVTVLFSLGFNKLVSTIQTTQQFQISGGVISSPIKKLNAGFNFDMAKNYGQEFRFGTSLDVSYYFLKYFTVSTGLRYNGYNNFIPSDSPYQEVVFTTKLIAVW